MGAWGIGWEVWCDGMEITQFTYFQQCGGIDLAPITVELTYGLERITMYLQQVDSVYDVVWVPGVTYGDVHHRGEVEFSTYNFEQADIEMHLALFNQHEAECQRLIVVGLSMPAYENCLKCSHYFNILDARGAISVTERQAYIGRVRVMARACAESYLAMREQLGFPLLKGQPWGDAPTKEPEALPKELEALPKEPEALPRDPATAARAS